LLRGSVGVSNEFTGVKLEMQHNYQIHVYKNGERYSISDEDMDELNSAEPTESLR
jgi:hypothetical protein